MNIVVMRRKKGCTGLVTLCHKKLALLAVGFLVAMPGALLYTGYQLGKSHMQANPDDPKVESFAKILYGQALIAEGSPLADVADFTRRINELLIRDSFLA